MSLPIKKSPEFFIRSHITLYYQVSEFYDCRSSYHDERWKSIQTALTSVGVSSALKTCLSHSLTA